VSDQDYRPCCEREWQVCPNTPELCGHPAPQSRSTHHRHSAERFSDKGLLKVEPVLLCGSQTANLDSDYFARNDDLNAAVHLASLGCVIRCHGAETAVFAKTTASTAKNFANDTGGKNLRVIVAFSDSLIWSVCFWKIALSASMLKTTYSSVYCQE
jgi:hypothetical protein